METKILKIDFKKPLEKQLEEPARIIKNGGLVVFPTETVYGLGASALVDSAAKKIYAAKGRPSDNPLIIHISDPAEAEKYCITNELYYELAREFMPGPLTVILPKRDIIPFTVTGGLQTVAVRCPSNPVANTLISLAGVPIAAPSANISGKPSPTAAEHVIADMWGKVDMIIDGGDCEIGLESTIVKTDGDVITVLRPGGITFEMLKTVRDDIRIDSGVIHKADINTPPLAPGMKYRHYAPRAQVYLICDDDTDSFDGKAIKFLKEKLSENEDVGVLCFDEYARQLTGKNIVTFGAKADISEHARKLFSCLRYFDTTDAKEIYATVSDTRGIGLALYNRMLKASGYNIINL